MRYHRHHVLKHIGKEGQAKLSKSTVAVVGLGAVGSVSAELLARAGVNLKIFDHDVVEESNLQRQLLYSEKDVGKDKVEAALSRLKEINSTSSIEGEKQHIARNNAEILEADVILDCTDNMRTRFIINEFSKEKNIPWIYAGAVEDRGFLYVTIENRPCFNCIFGNSKANDNCSSVGILNSSSATIASMQVVECLKILLGEEPVKDLVYINVWNNEFKKFKVSEKLKPKEVDKDYDVYFCNTMDGMVVKPFDNVDLDLKKLKEIYQVVEDAERVIVLDVDGQEVIVHDYGELFVKDEKNEDRLKELADKIYSAT